MIHPHEQRVHDEKAVLDNKLLALTSFIAMPRFSQLPERTKRLMRAQATIMESYSIVLGLRIDDFGLVDKD
jgi:hypothetical protein